MLGKIYDWLAVSDAPQQADVVFVLAGRECRKEYGLELFRRGYCRTLLLSVGRFEIRRFSKHKISPPIDLVSIAQSTVPELRHYFVTLDRAGTGVQHVAIGRFGTWSEIRALSRWLLERESVRTGIVLSSGFHLRRLRWCCRALVPEQTKLKFVAVPGEGPGFDREHWWRSPLARKLIILELVKTILYPVLPGIWIQRNADRRR